MKTKIFEGGSVKECLRQCLIGGYFPGNLREVSMYQTKNKSKVKSKKKKR